MTDHRPLPGQSPNLVAAMSDIASKSDLVEATSGLQEDMGNVFDALDGFGQTLGQAAQDAADALELAEQADARVDIVYGNAQYQMDGYAVSSGAVILGSNENEAGILFTAPLGYRRIITAVYYQLKSNTGTLLMNLVRRGMNYPSTPEDVIWQTNCSTSGLLLYPDNTIDYQLNHLDQVRAEVAGKTGSQSTLHVWYQTVLVEE